MNFDVEKVREAAWQVKQLSSSEEVDFAGVSASCIRPDSFQSEVLWENNLARNVCLLFLNNARLGNSGYL